MKRILALTFAMLLTAVCWAAEPELACDKLFNRKDLRAEGRDIVIINQSNNYFRSITAQNDKKLKNEIKKAFEQDRKKAFNYYDGYDSVRKYDFSILNIVSDKHTINIGLYTNDDGYVNLFIHQSDKSAVVK